MRTRVRILSAALALTVAATLTWAFAGGYQSFPHRVHARLFPTCAGCHAGMVTGAVEEDYPTPQTCANCHDGEELKKVDWSGPTPTPTNLRFSHIEHRKEATDSAGKPLGCTTCHQQAGTTEWMAVGRARPESCLGCHEHQAPAHLAQSNACQTCHVPLASARALPMERIAGFPKPPSHDQPDFLSHHAPTPQLAGANCATCHARESCERCHANAKDVEAIAAIPSDPRVRTLVAGKAPRYPTPASHRSSGWLTAHAGPARSDIQECANCHTQPGCQSCHAGSGPAERVIARLPKPVPGGATGAVIARRDVAVRSEGVQATGTAAQTRVHPAGFGRNHGAEASTQQLNCSGCHGQRFCTECHDGEGRRHYHPLNYVQRHPADSYGRERDCAQCHNTEAFCRTCHLRTGIASRGGTLNTGPSFHNSQPLWLLQHGRAARQGLQSCVTCHQQSDCMQCHSNRGWNVNPHGPDFDAERMAKRSKESCLVCHFTDPLAGR